MRTRIPPPRNALVSYHYFRDYDLDKLSRLRLIGDSGAFSADRAGARITVADLAAWARRWTHRLSWVAALDVIGDQDATRRNWREMREEHGVDAVPTIHFGASPDTLDHWADHGVDFVGLGGMVGVPVPRQMRWLVSVFRYARTAHPAMRFHGWGVTSDTILRLPFYSVDSSGWTSAMRYGRLTVRDPNSAADYAVGLNGRDVFAPEVARLLALRYGTNPAAVAWSSPDNRDLVVRLAALSASVAEQRFRRLHGPVSAPTWGMRTAQNGPLLHLASAGTGNADPAQLEALVGTDARSAVPGPHLHLIADAGTGWENALDTLAASHGRTTIEETSP